MRRGVRRAGWVPRLVFNISHVAFVFVFGFHESIHDNLGGVRKASGKSVRKASERRQKASVRKAVGPWPSRQKTLVSTSPQGPLTSQPGAARQKGVRKFSRFRATQGIGRAEAGIF